jgi:hypothetical protein
MKTEHQYWTIDKLIKNKNTIEYPEFQREPTVWDLEKKQKLIDSILRDFDISSIYFTKKENGGYDCIDGRQRINAIFSFLGSNGEDEEHNGFFLKIENEIYDDKGYFNEVNDKRFEIFDPKWKKIFLAYKLNIVEITEAVQDEELNLLFLRLQIASVLNAGEKLNAMTGDMKKWIFYNVVKHDFFNKITIPKKRFAREQVAAQIVLNEFSKKNNGLFQRSRYTDLQDFFKKYSRFSPVDKKLTKEIENVFNVIVECFNDKLKYVSNRAIAVSIYLFVSELIELGQREEIKEFVEFFIKFLRTLKWQIPKGVEMDKAYYDLLKFQTNIAQAAGERTAIQKRHDFLNEYFYFYRENGSIIGDKEYKQKTRSDPNIERDRVRLK